MDKERLRIPSDSSSGSSSHGGASPNPASYRNGSQTSYLLANNNIGPPPNSPANFSPLLQHAPHTLPPPPGLTHPNMNMGSIYQYPPGFQGIGYAPLGMPTIAPTGQAHLPGHHHYPAVSGVAPAQYNVNVNRFGVQNGMMQAPPTSPPPGYTYFGNLHVPPQPIPPPPCSIAASQPQNCSPFASQYVAYNDTGDPIDLEKRINLLLGETYENDSFIGGNGGNFISHLTPGTVGDELKTNGNNNLPFIGSTTVEEEKQQRSTDEVVGGVMNPIIENIVGSINNGAYTHFGPAITTADKMQNGQANDLFREPNILGRQNGTSDQDRKALFSTIAVNSAVTKEVAPVKEGNVGSISPGIKPTPINPVTSSATAIQNSKENSADAIGTFAKSPSPVGQPRASTPKESPETSSRPQTPGKPSYLEVLTKAGLKNQPTSSSSTARKTSSTSSSPVQSSFTANNSDSAPNLCHRKSVDYFVASTSSPSSSCPSASSSPATKPRSLMSGLILKGKENVSAVKQSGIFKNSPSNSPSHSAGQQHQLKGKSQSVGNERKVLTSQNNSSAIPSTSNKSGGKSLKNGKISFTKSFDLEEVDDEGEWGWKTYAPRGRNNNLNDVGNRNSKRASNGHCNSSESVMNNSVCFDDEADESEGKRESMDDVVFERKSGSSSYGSPGSSGGTSSLTHTRKSKEKEKPRNRREDRKCKWRNWEGMLYVWLAHVISALKWLWSLVTDVATMSASVGIQIMQNVYMWTKTQALPNVMDKVSRCRKEVYKAFADSWNICKMKMKSIFFRADSGSNKRPEETGTKTGEKGDVNILSMLGPERNIMLPANGDEALKRLLSVKGQDPYSILGVRSDSSDETIRKYYKRQAVLVHPDKNLIVGAEEAFKILARAFEMVGDPVKRAEYHQKLMEAQVKEKFCGEIGNLLEQLRKKMEAASSTIRCTKCNSRHKKNITDRPLFAARFCSQCKIHHGAREGELWAERGGWFGFTWNYFACMDAHVWEINEWARCQKANLKHIKADAHCVMYRLVAGGNNHQNHHHQHCHGNGASFEEGVGSEADEWDSLINNLYKSPPGSAFGKTTGVPGKTGCCANGNVNNGTVGSASQAPGRRRKGKRNK